MNLKPGDSIRRTFKKGPDPTDPMLDFHLGGTYRVKEVYEGNIVAQIGTFTYGIPRKYLTSDLFVKE